MTGRVQYGPRVHASAALAVCANYLPVARAARLVAALTGVSVSAGFTAGIRGKAAARLGPFMDRVRDLLRSAGVLYADETPARAADLPLSIKDDRPRLVTARKAVSCQARCCMHTIGATYTVTRRTEPRIAARVWAALGDARTVLNVGAGTGSYEPPGRDVTAVEPSAVMRAQRPAGAAPCVAATAESLPFEDQSFDAAMASTRASDRRARCVARTPRSCVEGPNIAIRISW